MKWVIQQHQGELIIPVPSWRWTYNPCPFMKVNLSSPSLHQGELIFTVPLSRWTYHPHPFIKVQGDDKFTLIRDGDDKFTLIRDGDDKFHFVVCCCIINFYKTLQRSSAFVDWISARFYGKDCKLWNVLHDLYLISPSCSRSFSGDLLRTSW